MFTSKLQSASNFKRQSAATDSSLTPLRSKKGRFAESSNASVSILSNKSIMGTPVTPNRSMQTTRFLDAGLSRHRLDVIGSSLPVAVTEALAFRDDAPSVKFSDNGWACLVVDRRLLVWNWNSTGKNLQCQELLFGETECANTTDLVQIAPQTTELNGFSCFASTPEGIVRYWPNILRPNVYSETILKDFHGKFTLSSYLASICCFVIGTNESDVFVLTPFKGQISLHSRLLTASAGVLAGIGRRVSSMFWRNSANTSCEPEKLLLHQMSAAEQQELDKQSLYLMMGPYLQKWDIKKESELLVYQWNVENLFKDGIANTMYRVSSKDLPSLKVWLLDMKITPRGVLIYGGGCNPDVSDDICLAAAVCNSEGRDQPQSFLSFAVSRYGILSQMKQNSQLLSYEFLVGSNLSNIYVYSKDSFLCLKTNTDDSIELIDRLDFFGRGSVLGAGVIDGWPVIFSSDNGFVHLKEISQFPEESMYEATGDNVTLNLGSSTLLVCSSEKIEELSICESSLPRLKAAFLLYARGDQMEARNLVRNIFPSRSGPQIANSSLDNDVLKLSQSIIDDFPASDPRWAESIPHDGLSTLSSLIVMHQIEDKLKAHEFYLKFLANVGLWDELSGVEIRGVIMSTVLLLIEHGEKLAAVKTLKELSLQYPELVRTGIEKTLQKRNCSMQLNSGLTEEDLFYREVSRFEDILSTLLQLEEEKLEENLSQAKTIGDLETFNSLLLALFLAANEYRQSKIAQLHDSTMTPIRQFKYIPWTSSAGERNIICLLINQHKITANVILLDTDQPQQQNNLLQQLQELTTIILDCYKIQIDWSGDLGTMPEGKNSLSREFQKQRNDLIRVFVKAKQYEKAAQLAEKYLDFDTLVQICDATNNQDRLQKYIGQYELRGFIDYVYQWYVDKGQRGKLIASGLAKQSVFKHLLESGENKFMSWLHDIDAGEFSQAHRNLYELAIDEKNFVAKKKTLLSMSKLALLASEDMQPEIAHRSLESIRKMEKLILYHEQVPEETLNTLGLNADSMSVLSPLELIQLFIGSREANEYSFKMAFELLNFVDFEEGDMSREDVLINIWCHAILRDDWSNIGIAEPLESCNGTVFFKTVELVMSENMSNIFNLLPSKEKLLNCEELGSMLEDNNFKFVISAGYERLQRLLR